MNEKYGIRKLIKFYLPGQIKLVKTNNVISPRRVPRHFVVGLYDALVDIAGVENTTGFIFQSKLKRNIYAVLFNEEYFSYIEWEWCKVNPIFYPNNIVLDTKLIKDLQISLINYLCPDQLVRFSHLVTDDKHQA